MTTAAVIIIGNEILTGKYRDENGPFFIDELRSLGVELERVVTVSDGLEQIGDEVRRCSEHHDVVFTTGGVGPTHDDLTLEAIAVGFGVPLERRDSLLELMGRLRMPVDEATVRMAHVPAGCELIDDPAGVFPILRFRNVYVLPGVPSLVRRKMAVIRELLVGERKHSTRVCAMDTETAVASALGRIAATFPDVEIGSYPRFGDEPWRLVVTLESRDVERLEQAREAVMAILDVVELG